MSALRTTRLRTLHHGVISPRKKLQCLRRHESTTIPNAPLPPEAARPPAPPFHKPSFIRRHRSTLLWSAVTLGVGFAVGKSALGVLFPSGTPQQGTQEDNVLMAELNKRIDEEFRVTVLRGKCLGVTKKLRGAESGWVEIVPPVAAGGMWDRDGEGEGEEKKTKQKKEFLLPFDDRLIDALQGAKGLGVERVFWDRGDKKLVAIVWFGSALSGWPGVTHGGLIATALTEKIALAASLARGGDGDFTAAVAPQRLPGSGNHATLPAPTAAPPEPAQISIDYVKPTYANHFHVIRVKEGWCSDENVRLEIPHHEYVATLETMDGKICVKATAKFAPRTDLERIEERVKEAVGGWTYRDFKEWMWPSRQKESLAV